MALHARQQITAALIARLTGLASTGARVYDARLWPMNPESMPGIIVYVINEVSEDGSLGLPRLQKRTCTAAIEA